MQKNKKKKVVVFVSGVCVAAAIGVVVYLFHEKICREVPEFIRMHGLWKSLRYMQGYDVFNEIYEELGI